MINSTVAKNGYMKIGNALFMVILLIGIILSCTKPPDYPDEPVIAFGRLTKTIIEQGNAGTRPDTLELIIDFTDGDGDIGSDSINVFLTDSRNGAREIFRINPIPKQGTGNGISGEIMIKMPNRVYFCCTFPNTTNTCFPSKEYPEDMVSYKVQIKDRAGNLSNEIETPPITILCN